MFAFCAAMLSAYLDPPPQSALRRARPHGSSRIVSMHSMSSERELLEECVASAVSRLKRLLDLQPSRYGDLLGVGMSAVGSTARGGVQGFTAPRESAISWCTVRSAGGDEEGYSSSIRLWNAPVTGVPHLLMDIGFAGEDDIYLRIDFLPRADESYAPSVDAEAEEVETEEGGYGQQWRRWWLESEERWYTPEAHEFAAGLRSLPGARAVPAQRAQLSGPLLVDVQLPKSEAGAKAVAAAYTSALTRWLGWKRVAMDRAARQGERDPADTSGTVGLCKVVGAASQAATIAAYAFDSTARAYVYADRVQRLEAKLGRPVMARNIAAGRAIHPLFSGAGARFTLIRMGRAGCTILAEAGPADPINDWTEERVYASTETGADDAAVADAATFAARSGTPASGTGVA